MVRSDFTAPTATPVTPLPDLVIEASATRIVFTLDLSEELLDVVPEDFEFQGDDADGSGRGFRNHPYRCREHGGRECGRQNGSS